MFVAANDGHGMSWFHVEAETPKLVARPRWEMRKQLGLGGLANPLAAVAWDLCFGCRDLRGGFGDGVTMIKDHRSHSPLVTPLFQR